MRIASAQKAQGREVERRSVEQCQGHQDACAQQLHSIEECKGKIVEEGSHAKTRCPESL